jgi:hypothetical protein
MVFEFSNDGSVFRVVGATLGSKYSFDSDQNSNLLGAFFTLTSPPRLRLGTIFFGDDETARTVVAYALRPRSNST